MSSRSKRRLELKLHQRQRQSNRRRGTTQLGTVAGAADRRGVLLMVVLSMLALFLLLGTAFLVSSNFYADSAKQAGKLNRVDNNPTDLLERAMLQVLRDTNNPSSVIRYHSLLRDVYGSDGFVARVFVPPTGLTNEQLFYPRFAGASGAAPYGPTGGQLIELYMLDDGPGTPAVPEAGDIVSLEHSLNGFAQDHDPAQANGYHEGSLLTMLSGPARGQSTRIVDYEYVGREPVVLNAFGLDPADPTVSVPMWRIRVMGIGTQSGETLTSSARAPELLDFVAGENIDTPNPNDFVGHAFMVNGRAFNGTGVGFNRLAAAGTPRLNAAEMMVTGGGVVGTEIALTPNSRFVNHDNSAMFLGGSDPFNILGAAATDFQMFNQYEIGTGNPISILYPNFAGAGGSDDSYDAVDYQNMFLAHMPLAPRARGGIVTNDGGVERSYELGSPGFENHLSGTIPCRIDLENTIVPSFHRPALEHYWFQRLYKSQWLRDVYTNDNERAPAVLMPYGENYQRPAGADPALDQIVAIKRKISLRPIPEDHPNFDGSNPLSRYSGSLSPVTASGYAKPNDMHFPAWEVVGPWDVDNDNDGIADSIWVDLGDPVQETENGTLYKPLYAFLIVDMDNKLNVNAHGSVDHFATTNFDPTNQVTGSIGNLVGGDRQQQTLAAGLAPGDFGFSATQWTSNALPVGMGWGPGDVSLRAILSPLTQPLSANYVSNFGDPNTNPGNPFNDDYARLLMGRLPTDLSSDAVWGRLGSVELVNRVTSMGIAPATRNVKPGFTFDNPDTPQVEALVGVPSYQREREVPFEFLGYPVADQVRSQRLGAVGFSQPSSFGSSPDMRGQYAVGIDYRGQPTYESVWDNVTININSLTGPFVGLVDDSPYETDLASNSLRGLPTSAVAGDDAPFATAELERLMRAYDDEAGISPSRLWDLVDTFDPNKYAITVASNSGDITPEELALAQANTSIARRQVTTDSYEIPTPADVVPSYITELGPDGLPGNLGDDDNEDSDNNGVNEEDVRPFDINTGLGEIGWYEVNSADARFLSGWSDDFASLTGKSVAEARLVDVLWYRIQRERHKRYQLDGVTQPYNWNHPAAVQILNNIAEQLLPPEVLAGYKMDVNRPFGDGRDNNGNGIVDEPIEAGEPYLDSSGDGMWTAGEPFIDLDGDGRFYADIDDTDSDGFPDGNGVVDSNDVADFDGDGVFEPVVDSLWQQQLGTAALVDNTMGKNVTGSPRYNDANGNNLWDAGEAVYRDDAHLARQLYSRHLYVMTLLLSDEDYVAPYNPADVQLQRYLNQKADELEAAGLPAADAKLEAQRKYSCRQMAQWAVNCVDFRDSDACMTPFEYDENPWDGWNCVDTASGTVIPIDSDPGTNENKSDYIDWANMGTTGQKVVSQAATGDLNAQDATRNIVWGAERPELLITETLAWHDRRTEDTTLDKSQSKAVDKAAGTHTEMEDDDLDQRLRPKGTLLMELYNPWSGDGQKPAELYRHTDLLQRPVDRNEDNSITQDDSFQWVDRDNADMDNLVTSGVDTRVEGVMLDKLSDMADRDGRRSPVWRTIVVEEHPVVRNDNDQLDDQPTRVDMTARESQPWQEYGRGPGGKLRFYPSDPDWDEMFNEEATIERIGTQNRTGSTPKNTAYSYNATIFKKPYPYIEREFYFASPTDALVRNWQAGAQVPRQRTDASVRRYTDLTSTEIDDYRPYRMPYRFVQTELGKGSFTHRFMAEEDTDVPLQIAPVLPGHYAVIGGGFRYRAATHRTREINGAPGTRRVIGDEPVFAPTFIAPIGRWGEDPASVGGSADLAHTGTNLLRTRRFELVCHPNPFLQQLLVGPNGANPDVLSRTGRSNEVFMPTSAANMLNATDVTDANDPTLDASPDAMMLQPCVAVAVDDMNISEPVYGYELREKELDELENEGGGGGLAAGGLGSAFVYRSAGGEGAYPDTPDSVYDTPFDTDPELVRTGTTANYRTLHLQRLADPTMPWNPPPRLQTAPPGSPADPHDPSLPVNPYLTVDSSSADLTAFNGVSRAEAGLNQNNLPQFLPYGSNSGSYLTSFEQRIDIQSLERGSEAVKTYANAADDQPLRALWGQEPENYDFRTDLWKSVDPADWNRVAATLPSQGQGAGTRRVTGDDIYQSTGYNGETLQPHYFDMVIGHTLGMPNQAFGQVIGGRAAAAQGEPQAAVMEPIDVDRDLYGDNRGAPAADADITGTGAGTTSTFPWFTWNNRPFVSESELLQVPRSSSSRMLKDYSVMNGEAQIDPYRNDQAILTGGGPNPPTIGDFLSGAASVNDIDEEDTNEARYQVHQAPFGSLTNSMQSSRWAARIFEKSTGELVPVGAPNYHRLLDYVHTPSRFVATDTLLNPSVFSSNTVNTVRNPDDPRQSLLAPFNRVADYREPGKVNLNTVVGQRVPPTRSGLNLVPGEGIPQLWSDVYDGLMHRVRDANLTNNNGTPSNPNDDTLLAAGHFGPAWRDVVLSRRGYADPTLAGSPTGLDRVELVLDPTVPTFFSNPFRSAEAGDLVPLESLVKSGVEASTLRSHPYQPGEGLDWGDSNFDNDASGLVDDAREAGIGNDLGPFVTNTGAAAVPLFSELTSNAAVDGTRNPGMHYMPLTRLDNLTTNRSGVFGVWVTVGYFEVSKAPRWDGTSQEAVNTQQKFSNQAGGDLDAARALYNRVYPQGYQLGKELGSETGDIDRQRAFYIIDRTRPVAFKPGEDVNVEDAILLRRRIE